MTTPKENSSGTGLNLNNQTTFTSKENSLQLLDQLYECIEVELNSLNYSYQKPSLLAKAILETSDYFIQQKGLTPWTKKDMTAAYIAHFLPMNILRWLKVFDRIEGLNFHDLKSFFDFGAGPQTFKIAHFIKYQNLDLIYDYFELNKSSSAYGEKIFTSLINKYFNNEVSKTPKQSQQVQNISDAVKKSDTLVLSYSLNELKETPKEFWNFKNILILEPSTQKLSRLLLEFKDLSQQYDFSPIAPCTHSEKCPLYFESKKDWCFDRTAIQIPKIANPLYKILPFDTANLTFSYLWISKNKPENKKDNFRVVGDWQKEKGKVKSMICRSSQREFLSLLNRDDNGPFNLKRGDISTLDFPFEMKGNEIRRK